jgi:hypothetical protein
LRNDPLGHKQSVDRCDGETETLNLQICCVHSDALLFYSLNVWQRCSIHGEGIKMLCMDVEGKLTLLKTREAQIARQPDNWQRVTCYINFQGEATIARKAEWPGWRPTPDMIARIRIAMDR